LWLEPLEARTVPAGPSWAQQLPFDNVTAGSVLNAAPALTLQPVSGGAILRDLIKGQIASGTADVAWYQLTLTSAATVSLRTFDPSGSSFAGVISLYNDDPDALVQNLGADGLTLYPNDPLDPVGHRLLAQAVGSAGAGTSLTWSLAAGTYFVAISGVGNQYFHPFVADSGLAGSSGAFELAIQANSLNVGVPVVLEANPADGSVLASSPLVLRVDLNQGIDPNSLVLNQPSGNTIQLLYSADGTFTTGVQSVFLQAHFSPPANDPVSPGADELQLTPSAPLQDGYYRLLLQGIGTLASPSTDTTIHFTVASGRSLAGDDTAATSHDLGNLSNGNLVQVAGAIGTDPYYSFFDPNNPNPSYAGFAYPDNYAGADVNLYHFRINTPGNYIFLAEAFAGRIGSPLDPGLSLFQIQGNQFKLLAANQQTFNPLVANGDNGYSGLPLYNDSFLSAGLQAGDYFIAVSSGPNTPDPLFNHFPGVGDVFTPVVAHSGSSAFNNADALTIGPYVLSLRLASNPGAPHVVSVTPASSTVPIPSPTQLVVRFDQAMNLQQLAFAAYQTTTADTLSSVFVRGANGIDYFPRFVGYDPSTFTATFQMLDALPNGTNVLHLSGALGLQNLGGTPLAGSYPGGDFLVTFDVQGQNNFSDHEPNDTFSQAQQLGTLFPLALQAGIPVVRNFATGTTIADTADTYQFQLTQARQYTFTLTGSALSVGAVPQIYAVPDPSSLGVVVPVQTSTQFFNGAVVVTAVLQPGVYDVQIGGWSPLQAPGVAYRLNIAIGQASDNPTALTVGAAPAVSIRLVNAGMPAAPPVVLPNGTTFVLPVGLTSGNPVSSLANLLPSSVLAHGALGGFVESGGGIAAGGNGLARISGSSAFEDVLDLIVLTQLGGDPDPDVDATSLATLVESFTAPLQGGVSQLLDWVFRLGDWVSPPSAATPGPAAGADADSAEMEDADKEARAVDSDPFAAPGDYDDQSWVGAVAALALYHGDTQRRRGSLLAL
jgi:hypothetical protein